MNKLCYIFILFYTVSFSQIDTNEIIHLNNISDSCLRVGNYKNASRLAEHALELSNTRSFTPGIVKSSNILGTINYMQGNYPIALRYLFRSLQVQQLNKNIQEIGISYGNIGQVYEMQGKYGQSISFYQLALREFRKLNDTKNIANCYSNISSAYYNWNDIETACKYLKQAITLQKSINANDDLSSSYGNLGIFFKDKLQYDSSLYYFEKALKLKESINDLESMSVCYYNISQLLIEQHKYQLAKYRVVQSLKIAQDIGIKDQLSLDYAALARIDSLSGNYLSAYKYFTLHIRYRDSLINEEEIKTIAESEMNYKYEIKYAVTKSEYDKNLTISRVQQQRQKIVIIIGIIAFMLVAILCVYAYRNYLEKVKANKIISEQKLLVDDKQQEILASIRHAKKIQQMLLPSEKYIETQMNRLRNS